MTVEVESLSIDVNIDWVIGEGDDLIREENGRRVEMLAHTILHYSTKLLDLFFSHRSEPGKTKKTRVIQPASPPYIHNPDVVEAPIPSNSHRPVRLTKKPSYLQDYHCFLSTNTVQSHVLKCSTDHSLSDIVDYSRLSPKFRAIVLAISSHFEPKFFHQAKGIPVWDNAMDKKIAALESNGTWNIVSLPASAHAIGCKWVYKIKYNADGSVERFKARLLAKGFSQQEGVDYNETFSLVTKLVSVKLILALAAIQGWFLHQLDVNNVFLHGYLHEEVFMTIPPGSSAGIFLSQRHYALQLVEDLGHLGCKAANTSMEVNLKLNQDGEDALADPKLYRRTIGKLQYLTITRPDSAYTVNKLSQFLVAPRATHMNAAIRALQYFKGTPGQDLFYATKTDIQLQAYTNADWAACVDTRRSTLVFVCSLETH
uniref:Reverse transcriptase Ty1/copia-type domain-containing protein n=1 Tax=Cannabis sativa TaxID=3483 RepID=A0A803PM20_CANSA